MTQQRSRVKKTRKVKVAKTKPNFKKHPKKITLPVSGKKLKNPDAGCGPDMFRFPDGQCRRKFDAEVLQLLCPQISLKKGALNPRKLKTIMKKLDLKGDPFTATEIELLDLHCKRLNEQVKDEAQSMDARDIYIYELLKDVFATMPFLFGKKMFDEFFGVIGYKATKIRPGFVEIKKKVESASGKVVKIVKQIPFGAISERLKSYAGSAMSKAFSASKYMAAGGFVAYGWVINSPMAQRFMMHLVKILKLSICTAFGQLEDRNNMDWKEWAKEKAIMHKTDISQLLEKNAGIIGKAMSSALVSGVTTVAATVGATASGGTTLVVGIVVSKLSTLVIEKAAQYGKLDDFYETFGKGCSQFKYGLKTNALTQHILGAGIGTYGPKLLSFCQSLDPQKLQALIGI